MDNRHLDIVCEGSEMLALALKLAWEGAPGGKATHYRIVRMAEKTAYFGNPVSQHETKQVVAEVGTSTLVLYWHGAADAISLPYPMGYDEALPFVSGWLKSVDYEDEPDHDGSNGQGWRMFNDYWGHVGGDSYAFLGIQPAWALYGK